MLNIFLDLEGTVIDEFKEFPTFLPSNCEDIKRFIAPFAVMKPKLFVFSFAIQIPEEGEIFRHTIRHELEKQIDHEIETFIWVPAMLTVSRRLNFCASLDMHDFIMLIGKERAFHDWCNLNHAGEFNFLIDDVVPNRTTHDNEMGTVIQTLNVRDLFRTFRIPRKVPA